MSRFTRRLQRVQHDAISSTVFTPSGMRPISAVQYGVTIDNASGISQSLANQQALSLQMFSPRIPTARIVFDESVAATEYDVAVNTLMPVCRLMGEILDSLYLPQYTVQQLETRTNEYLGRFGDKVDIWEIGNEVNGNWTGNYSAVSAKIQAVYNVIKTAGKRTALTLYYNLPTSDGVSELYPHTFAEQYVPQAMRDGIDFLLLSYYPQDQNNVNPTALEWRQYFEQLHVLFPNALMGFGEIGLTAAATAGTLTTAQNMIAYYYTLSSTIDLRYYIGGYFWWYYAEDAVPYTKPLWQNLYNGMMAY